MTGVPQIAAAVLVLVLGQSPTSAPPVDTPGSVALLAGSTDADAQARLAQALTSPNPAVRATAGRVIAAVPHPNLRAQLLGALARERDSNVASELLRDLLNVAGRAAADAVDAQVRRLGRSGVDVYAEWLGRAWPERLIEKAADLVALAPDAGFDLAGVFTMSAAQHPEMRDRLFEAWKAAAPRAVLDETGGLTAERRGPARARIVAPIGPNTLSSLLDTTGCKAVSDDVVGLAVVEYRDNGRPARITVDPTGLSAACQKTLTIISRLTIAESDYAVNDGPQTIVLPLHREVVGCMTQPRADSAEMAARVGQLRSGAKIKQPTKLRDVKPQYPLDAQKSSIQGVVIVEAQIAPSGCIESARVVRSVVPSLDIAALRAVSRWLFTPTEVDGKPVPVIMMATVNFVLQ